MAHVKDSISFLHLARERYTYALSCDAVDRKEAADDVLFVAGQQWTDAARESRRVADRPCLTENKLGIYTAKVVNDGRQSKPSIRLTPLDGGTTATAEMLQGRVRHIEYETDSDIAYDQAREHQVTSGRGFVRVTTRYKDRSFEQELRIEPIANQFSVLFDPDAREYDRSDAEYCFVLTNYSKGNFERKFGADTEVVRQSFYTDTENPAPQWIGSGVGGDNVQVAEYWLKEYTKRTLCLLNDGKTAFLDEVPEGAQIMDRRPVDDPKVCQYIIDGVEVHDKTPWLGSTIPIVPFWGKEMMVEGTRRTYSLIRFAKDPQRLVNLYVSNIAEQIAQMPKAPYIAAEGQLANHEDEWESINLSPIPVVQYRPVVITVNGVQAAVPPPRRETNEPPIQALTVGLNQAIDAIKAAMGIFDASLGAQGNETSGIAIQRRKQQADNANFHFHDNEARSRKRIGRILLEMIPQLDRGEKTVQVRAEDGKTKAVRINTPQPYRDDQTGEVVHHQIDQGAEYSVAIATGPSFSSAREEAFDTYSQIAQADKNFMAVAGDVLFRNMDAPGANEIADRYEQAVIPPQLRPKKPGQQQIPPEVQQKMQVYAQTIEQLTQTVHSQAQAIEQKSAEIEGKKWMVALQEQTKLTILEAQLNAQNSQALLKAEVARIGEQLGHFKDAVMQDAAHEHEQALQQQDHQHQADQQASAQANQQGMQASDQQAAADQAAAEPAEPTAGAD